MKIKFTGIVFLILFTVLASFAQTYDREKIWELACQRLKNAKPPDYF